MAYVHHSKSLVHFLLLFYKNKECPQIQLRKMLDFGKQTNLNDIGTAKSKFIFTFHRVTPASWATVMLQILFFFFQTLQKKCHFLSHYSILLLCLKMGKTMKIMEKCFSFPFVIHFSSKPEKKNDIINTLFRYTTQMLCIFRYNSGCSWSTPGLLSNEQTQFSCVCNLSSLFHTKTCHCERDALCHWP